MVDAIAVHNLSKIYHIPSLIPWRRGRTTEALRDVSFACPAGRISCLLGPNGAGKTTIVKILAGLIVADAGRAEILGRSLGDGTPEGRAHIGLATPNERSFYWRLTGRQNLSFYGALYNLRRRERRERVEEVLSVVELGADAEKPFRLYSAGMKQKLVLARALLGRPQVLLLDEPTTHLDPVAREALHTIIRDRFVEAAGTTILLCTHDLAEAEGLADHVIVLGEGTVRAEGSLASLRSKLRPHLRLRLLFDRLPAAGWDRDVPVTVRGCDSGTMELEVREPGAIPDVVKAVVAAGGRLLGVERCEDSLAEVFARLTVTEGEAP